MSNTRQRKRIVVVGAGPAGLLTTILLLRRNQEKGQKYHVTLVDPGVDHGKLDGEGLRRVRSWMIGLSVHGLSAIQSVDGLYSYVEKLGVQITSATVALSKSLQITDEFGEDEKNNVLGFTVDRNYICAGLARYLHEKMLPIDGGSSFTAMYETTALLVDGETKTLMVRGTGKGSKMESVSYDVVIGCDGVRSVVRGAMVQAERDFEFDLRGTFGKFKSLHVPRPPDVPSARFYYLVNSPPNTFGVVLPEPGDQINLGLGYADNVETPPALLSDDPKQVADYFRENFHLFDLDCEALGKEWVSHSWSTTGQVHCNVYHSNKLSAIIIGDAAHATTPNIGQGMNTALADAKALDEILDDHSDNWDAALPVFSELRVKEGNALTDLSFHTFSIDKLEQTKIFIRQAVRQKLNKILPTWLYDAEPMNEVAKGMKLSEVYNRMVKLGYFQNVRRINDDIMREHFERKVGMVKDEPDRRQLRYAVVAALALAAGLTMYRRR